MRNRVKIITALVVLLTALQVRAERWTVVPDNAEVVFTSKAPLETFKGRTGQIRGWVDWNPGDLAAPLDGEIVVDLASLDTGKKKRNQHMRENHLETDLYPVASLRPVAVISRSSPSLQPGSEAVVRVQGEFDLHGVTRSIECDVSLGPGEGGNVKVKAAFPVLLGDHNIERPKFLIMKLADEQKVEIMFELQPPETP